MKLNRGTIGGGLVLVLVLGLSISAIVNDFAFSKKTHQVYNWDLSNQCSSVSGVSEMVVDALSDGDYKYINVSVEKTDNLLVTSVAEDTSVTREGIELTEEQSAWMDYLFADVSGMLNVRDSASLNGNIIGKIGENARATILERGEEWTKISSGNVEGYVYNKYCIFGVEALAYAEDSIGQTATPTTTVNVRSDMSTEASIIKTAEAGKKLVVSKETPVEEGWVAVIVDGKTGYISKDYATIDYNVGTALTLEEEAEVERQRKAEEMKNKQVSPPGRVYGSAITLTDEELEVLAALLACEAGDNYEGCVAVAAVICNRIKSPYWPNTFYGVIYQQNQFYPADSGKLARQIARGTSSQVYAAAKEALSGADPTNGCLSFRASYTGHPGYLIGGNVFF